MTPILVEPLSEQALELLWQLEKLGVLRILPTTESPAKPAGFSGLLPRETGERMLREQAKLRDEWEREV
jgi:hypothetical protein